MFKEIMSDKSDNQFENIYKYIKQQEKLVVIDDILYFYDEERSYYIKSLSKNEELLRINSMLKDGVRDRVTPKTIENILKKIKIDSDFIINNTEKLNPQWYANCKNGTLNLNDFTFKKTIDRESDLVFTYRLDFSYCEDLIKKLYEINQKSNSNNCALLKPSISPNACIELLYNECTTFKKYAKTSLDNNKEKIILLLQSMAYMCTDLSQARKAFIYLGKTASGKSILAKFLIQIIGENNVSSIPINKLGDKFNIGQLGKYRVNISTELSRNNIRNVDILKSAISGDRLFGDKKGVEGSHFFSKTKILQLCNYLPNTTENDDSGAFVDRLIVILFNTTICEEERDRDLLQNLLNERDKIMTIAFLLLEDVIKNKFIFKQPQESIDFLNDYSHSIAKEIKEFIEERCECGEGKKEFTTSLYNEYKEFCNENFLEYCSRRDFLYSLDRLGYKRSKFRIESKNCRGYHGIQLKKKGGNL